VTGAPWFGSGARRHCRHPLQPWSWSGAGGQTGDASGRTPAATPPCHNPHNNPDGLGDENKGCLSKTERATVGRWNSSPWKGCSPFSGRSWIVISNTTSGSLAISGRSVLRPCFACGGPKPTKTANIFHNLSVTHLKNDTANYLGLGRTRLAFSVRKHGYCAARSAPQVRSRASGQNLTLRIDQPLPGDQAGGSISRAQPLRGTPAGLDCTTTPTSSCGPGRLAHWPKARQPNLRWASSTAAGDAGLAYSSRALFDFGCGRLATRSHRRTASSARS